MHYIIKKFPIILEKHKKKEEHNKIENQKPKFQKRKFDKGLNRLDNPART